MKTLELPGLNPAPKTKPVQVPTPTPAQTSEEEPFWVWCPPAYEIELDYQHPDFPAKFISRQLLVKDCRKPESDGCCRLYESYFLDELEMRKITISREQIREIIEEYYR